METIVAADMKLRMREIRKDRGLTQQQVADMAGISQSYYTDIENGKKQVNANRLEGIARALRVAPTDLIFDPSKAEDQERLSRLRALSEEQKVLVDQLISQLLSAQTTRRR